MLNKPGREAYHISITEIAGIASSEEEIQRLCNRYIWAGDYCRNCDVLELSCGTAQGSGYLSNLTKKFWASDYSWENLCIAHDHYGQRLGFLQLDAQSLPFKNESFDIIVLLESIYFIPSARKVVRECARVLRQGGKLLITGPNKDLYDFHPCGLGFDYHNVPELEALLADYGFSAEFYGDTPVGDLSWVQRALRPVKALAVKAHLMPQTRLGKRLLRRLVFGPLQPMPQEIDAQTRIPVTPTPIPNGMTDRDHKVIFCAATLQT